MNSGRCGDMFVFFLMKDASYLYIHVAKYKITNLLSDGRKFGQHTSKGVVQAKHIVNCI